MDLCINKSVKEFMQGKFRGWYSEQVQDQLSEGKEITLVDLIVENGFKAEGLLP